MAELSEYLQQQMREALGPVNRWYCAQYYGYEVSSPEILLAYYIKHGGASHFRLEHQLDPKDGAAKAMPSEQK